MHEGLGVRSKLRPRRLLLEGFSCPDSGKVGLGIMVLEELM